MIKRILCIAIVIVMLFTVVVFTACNTGNSINCICESDCYGECNFTLTIEVESLVLEATYREGCGRPGWVTEHGQYLAATPPAVMATLTNISGKRATIARRDSARTAVSFNLNIPTGEGWVEVAVPSPPRGGWTWVTASLNDGEYIDKNPSYWNFDFPRGEHEATVSVSFYINHRSSNRQLVNIKYTFVFAVI